MDPRVELQLRWLDLSDPRADGECPMCGQPAVERLYLEGHRDESFIGHYEIVWCTGCRNGIWIAGFPRIPEGEDYLPADASDEVKATRVPKFKVLAMVDCDRSWLRERKRD